MSSPTDKQIDSAAKQGFAFGISIVAAALLFVAGLVSIFQGISAIANDELFVIGPNYIFEFNLTAWGWIHLILGIIGVLIAGGLALGADWARVAAIVIASLSIVVQFLWLPYYPAWAILIIVLDLIVIWAVSTWDPDRAYNL
ncbi:DUF7144 family membrane protein [Gordonia paraffinivorans]|uniref:DUF7144 domain-containing protein n=2 Tax=Gordonia paraffinivorans TaxID=175628 RepID=A0ABQ0IP93_9ACTN|nr:hypothetical protein [Gordonia paraffinivorans]MBY4574540.1 hypothetical protein [Gordonia paraffinivorans]MCD2144887.1 hypothetical protein [Gordonia paraffinivorans]PWD41176.1 hypothetical protein ACN93_20245 [Gordonia paraffinivorans]VFA88576.1 Uncharacterised protein [Gordonia paraffinivorans]GAC85377.1 hypothetical protein GP2_034_00320 [Gordonia paraffinivorans NBRC 108238]